VNKALKSYNIKFQGIDYIVDIIESKNNSTVYVEYADIDDDVEETELQKLSEYLIREGFVSYKE